MPQTLPAGKRLTLGLLTTGMWHSLSVELWRGVLQAARSRDVNVICYAGDELHAHHEAYTEMPNVLYDLVSPERLDGLILWASSVGSLLSDGELEAFCARFAPIPILCVGRRVKGHPLLGSDALGGVRLVLNHLIREHGFQRIAFIRGPDDNVDAEQRFQTYLDALREQGIPFQPELATPPAPWRTANENVRILLDERKLRPGVDFQAIMAVGDVIAARTIRTLQERGYNVPQDLAVAGFDGEEAAKEASPLQITTSPLMMYEQGFRAVKILLAGIAGETIPEETILPSYLLVRQTCGCLSPVIVRAGAAGAATRPAPAATWQEGLAARRPEAIRRLRAMLDFEATRLPEDWTEQLWDSFVNDLETPGGTMFLSRLSVLQEVTMAAGLNQWGVWQDLLTVLRQEMRPALVETSVLDRAADLWQQARIGIAEADTRWQVFIQLRRRYQDYLLREAGQRFITLFDIPTLVDALAVELPRLRISATYLSLYEDPKNPAGDARLIFALGPAGMLPESRAGIVFPARRLVPDGLLPGDRPFALMLSPLYFRDTQLGLAVFEADPGTDEIVYDSLPRLLSSALQGALLVRTITERDQELERLATIDVLTGIANRRHFFNLAEMDIQRARRYRRDAAVIMMDLDHFKQVNDEHGHAIGDEVLRVVADRLKGVLRQTDLLGRYGGEEFVVLLSETGPGTARVVADRLRTCIGGEPIQTSGPAICITISVGVASLNEEAQELSGLLNRADAAMYAAKHAGRNQVVCL